MKKIIISMLVFSLVLVFAAGVAQAASEATAPAIDENAKVRVTPSPSPTPVSRPNVILPGWPTTEIEADTKNVTVYFPNPEKNEGYYYLAFDLWVALPEEDIEEGTATKLVSEKNEETGEETEVLYAMVYSSGLVPAGYCLQDIELVQPIHAGSYKAFASMQPYYADTYSPTPNSGSMAITLNVVKPEEEPVRQEGFSTDGRVIVTPNP